MDRIKNKGFHGAETDWEKMLQLGSSVPEFIRTDIILN